MQEEIRIGQAGPSSSTHTEEEEGLALASKEKGKKKRKGGKKNIDFLKVKCFQVLVSQDGSLCITVSREKEEEATDSSFNNSG